MPTNIAYPVFRPNPADERVPGSVAAATGAYPWPGQSPSGASSASSDPYGIKAYQEFLRTPEGQQYNTAQEAAAAQSRKVADDEMARAHQALKLQAQKLIADGRYQDAQILISKGEQEIARKRLDQEMKIHQDTFGLDQQKFGEQQYEFGQTHGLDLAKAYTTYAATPDQRFAASDFADALTRVGQGLGTRPYGTTAGTPAPKTFEGFAQLAGIPPGGAVTTPTGVGYTPPSGAAGAPPATPTGTGSTTDPRLTAASAVMKAIPPSDSDGHDISDQAALAAIQNIYHASAPGSYERLLPGQQKTFAAGLGRLGYSVPDALAQMKRNGIGQGAVGAY